MSLDLRTVEKKIWREMPVPRKAKTAALLPMSLTEFLNKPIPPKMFNDPFLLGHLLRNLMTVAVEMVGMKDAKKIELIRNKMREIIEGMEKKGCVINQADLFKTDIGELEAAVSFAYRRYEDEKYHSAVLNYLLLPYQLKSLRNTCDLVKHTLIEIFPALGERPFGPGPSPRFSAYVKEHPEVRQMFEKTALPLVHSISSYQQKNWDTDIQPHARGSENSYYFFWAYLLGNKDEAARYIDMDKTLAGRKHHDYQKQTLLEFTGYRLHALDSYAAEMDADTNQRLAELDAKLKACMRKV